MNNDALKSAYRESTTLLPYFFVYTAFFTNIALPQLLAPAQSHLLSYSLAITNGFILAFFVLVGGRLAEETSSYDTIKLSLGSIVLASLLLMLFPHTALVVIPATILFTAGAAVSLAPELSLWAEPSCNLPPKATTASNYFRHEVIGLMGAVLVTLLLAAHQITDITRIYFAIYFVMAFVLLWRCHHLFGREYSLHVTAKELIVAIVQIFRSFGCKFHSYIKLRLGSKSRSMEESTLAISSLNPLPVPLLFLGVIAFFNGFAMTGITRFWGSYVANMWIFTSTSLGLPVINLLLLGGGGVIGCYLAVLACNKSRHPTLLFTILYLLQFTFIYATISSSGLPRLVLGVIYCLLFFAGLPLQNYLVAQIKAPMATERKFAGIYFLFFLGAAISFGLYRLLEVSLGTESIFMLQGILTVISFLCAYSLPKYKHLCLHLQLELTREPASSSPGTQMDSTTEHSLV